MLLGSRARRPIPGLQDMGTLQDVGDVSGPALPDFNGPRVLDKRTGKAEWTDTGIKGALQRAGDFLGSDVGRGALLRSAAATFDGGLGKGLAAGAAYVDGQKELDQRQQQRDLENELAVRGVDLNELRAQQQNDLGWAGVETTMRGQDETRRSNMAREQLGIRGQNVDMRGQDVSRANNTDQTRLGYARIQEDGRQADDRLGLGYYGANLGYMGDQARTAAGIGSKGAYTETVTKTPAKEATNPWFGEATPATPATETTTRAELLATPSPQAIQALKGNPNLAAQFDAKYGRGQAAQHLGGL